MVKVAGEDGEESLAVIVGGRGMDLDADEEEEDEGDGGGNEEQ